MHKKKLSAMVLIGEGLEAIIQCLTDNDKMSAAMLSQKERKISPVRVCSLHLSFTW